MGKSINQFNISDGLQGKFLISTPSMLDNRFFKAVILITEHSSKGAMGVVINKPSAYQFSHILKDLSKNATSTKLDITSKINIVMGGPVATNNLFIIHNNDYQNSNTKTIREDLCMTNNTKIIFDIANNVASKKHIIALGCATWQEGQLEKELYSNSWILSESNNDIIFDNPIKIFNKVNSHLNILNNNAAFFIQEHNHS